MMMMMAQALVFAGALALIGHVLAATLFPALPRMAKLLRGEVDPAAFAPGGGPAFRPAAGRARRTAAPAAGWREAA